nr:MAG TPA: hypothetical protein [Caudoviricetes sp.]
MKNCPQFLPILITFNMFAQTRFIFHLIQKTFIDFY